MKLRGLNPNFFIHISGSDLYIPMIGLIRNLYFPVLHESTLGSTAGADRRPRNRRQVPCPPSAAAVEQRDHINDQHTNFQFGKLWIVNGNN